MNYRPSKKFIKTISIIFGSFLLLFILSLVLGKKEVVVSVNSGLGLEALTMGSTVKDLVEKDSDNDSIPDWEEALWETDPFQKDTNNDGVLDNIEIENKKKILAGDNYQPNNTEELTETERFARELFTTTQALRQSGQLDQANIDDLFSQINLKSLTNEVVDYTLSDLNIDEEKDPNLFVQEIKALAQKYGDQNLGQELGILSDAVATDDQELFNQLIEIGNGYQAFAADALKMPVSDSLAKNHLNLINYAIKTGISVIGLSKAGSDPIQSVQALKEYNIWSQKLTDSLEF